MRKLRWAAMPVLAISCAPGAVTKPLAQRPTLAPEVCENRGPAEPLIVEWSGAERARLEALARKGVVVVRYEGCKLQLMPSCRVSGKYEFAPLTKKHERVSIKNANDLYTKIPVGAAGLEAKLQQSGELNADMTIVGRWEADQVSVRVDELTGDCAGATHVITGLTTGAFRFYSGASADVAGSATVMGAGAGGSSKSSSELLNEDGDFASCAVDGSAKAPPSGCGSLMRLEVAPIGEEMLCPPKTAWKGKACVTTTDCPRGAAYDYGACPSWGVSYTLSAACESSDVAACEAECTAGNAESCAEMAHRYSLGKGVSTSVEKAATFVRKACDLGSLRGCGNAATFYASGSGGLSLDEKKAVVLAAKACDGGWYPSCYMLGEWHTKGTHVEFDLAKATTFMRGACDHGLPLGCARLGDLLRKDDPSAALIAYQRGCKQSAVRACATLAVDYYAGSPMVGDKDFSKAVTYARPACDSGVPKGCAVLGMLMTLGTPEIPQDMVGAARLFTQACNGDYAFACYRLGVAYWNGAGVAKDTNRAELLFRKSCEKGEKQACESLTKIAGSQVASATKPGK